MLPDLLLVNVYVLYTNALCTYVSQVCKSIPVLFHGTPSDGVPQRPPSEQCYVTLHNRLNNGSRSTEFRLKRKRFPFARYTVFHPSDVIVVRKPLTIARGRDSMSAKKTISKRFVAFFADPHAHRCSFAHESTVSTCTRRCCGSVRTHQQFYFYVAAVKNAMLQYHLSYELKSICTM